MRKPRSAVLLTLLLFVLLIFMAGCAPRAGAGQASAESSTSGLFVDLPAIVIDYDVEGVPAIGGIPLSQFSGLIPPETAEQLVLGSETVAQLQSLNIQNLQVNNSAAGLDLSVNGLPVPSLSWDAESLSSLVGLVGALGQDIPALDQLLPLLTDLGVAAVLRFPPAEGVDVAPLNAETTTAADMQTAQDAFIDAVEQAPMINLPIFYNSDGTWNLAGMSQEEWSALAGQPLDALALPPELVASLSAAGISELTIATSPAGVEMMVDGNALPSLSWSEGRINNLLEIVVGSGGLADSGIDGEALLPLLDQLLPIIQTTDLSVRIFLPES